MARGEPSKTVPQGAGIAIGASLTALVILVGAVIVGSTRSCESEDPTVPPPPATLAESVDIPPGLAWRDGEQALVARGYRQREAVRSTLDLPAVYGSTFGDRCGVVLVRAVGSAFIRTTTPNEQPVSHAYTAGFTTVGVCGDTAIAIEGTGPVQIEEWEHETLTASEVRALGISPEAALVHAEVERNLAAFGYVAAPQIVRDDLPVGATVVVPRPTEGCAMLVTLALGDQHAVLLLGTRCADGSDRGIDLDSPSGGTVRVSRTTRAYHRIGGPILPSRDPAPVMQGVTRVEWSGFRFPPALPPTRN